MHHIHPNLIAYFALLIWPVVAVWLYLALPFVRATLWTILGGYLLLPVGTQINFHMVPAFDKSTIPNLAAYICCVTVSRRKLKFLFEFGVAELFLLGLIIGPVITSMLNTDPIRIKDTYLPGVGLYDGISAATRQVLLMLPFFIGRQFIRTSSDLEEVFRTLVIAGLLYSLPMLFEVRMSPQLNNLIYGYFPSRFLQEFRDGGFRPVVFLGHGLAVAFFTMTTVVAAATLWRTRGRFVGLRPGVITGYLSFVLLLCKTVSTFLYAFVSVPLVRWATPRAQMRLATILVIITLGYPMLRVAELVPTTSILELAQKIDSNRAASLRTRFENGEQLLKRAWERKWFGWGRYGRNRVYNGWEGRDSSITDGLWIITLGSFGLFGFVAKFGLLSLPVFRARQCLNFAQTAREKQYIAALAVIVGINVFNLLPNSSLTPWTWLLAGSLLGCAETLRVSKPRRELIRPKNPAAVQVSGGHRPPT